MEQSCCTHSGTKGYSSDTRPEGGVGVGAWSDVLHQHVAKSVFILAILTKTSLERPWIIWECGLATGQENTEGVIPILFDMNAADLVGPLAGFQAYAGDKKDAVTKLCLYLCQKIELCDLTEEQIQPAIEQYMKAVQKFNEEDTISRLFGSGFHKPDKTLEGNWETIWRDGEGNIFETDTFEIFMYENKVRIVGKGAKGYTYPMEGRLSADRVMSLSYWSQAQITVSGVVLLRVSPNGLKMKGQWIGHTTKDFDEEDMRITHGTVECKKIQ